MSDRHPFRCSTAHGPQKHLTCAGALGLTQTQLLLLCGSHNQNGCCAEAPTLLASVPLASGPDNLAAAADHLLLMLPWRHHSPASRQMLRLLRSNAWLHQYPPDCMSCRASCSQNKQQTRLAMNVRHRINLPLWSRTPGQWLYCA